MNNLPKVVWVKVERTGVEPASFYVASQHRNHCSVTRRTAESNGRDRTVSLPLLV